MTYLTLTSSNLLHVTESLVVAEESVLLVLRKAERRDQNQLLRISARVVRIGAQNSRSQLSQDFLDCLQLAEIRDGVVHDHRIQGRRC